MDGLATGPHDAHALSALFGPEAAERGARAERQRRGDEPRALVNGAQLQGTGIDAKQKRPPPGTTPGRFSVACLPVPL